MHRMALTRAGVAAHLVGQHYPKLVRMLVGDGDQYLAERQPRGQG
jgi:hypothetical protein